MNDEIFELKNDKPKPAPWRPPAQPQCRQSVLFCGLDDSPGQENLFETDGQPPPREEHTRQEWEAEYARRRAVHAQWCDDLPADEDVDPSRGINLTLLPPGSQLTRSYYHEDYANSGPFSDDRPPTIQARIRIVPDNSVLTREQKAYLAAHTFGTWRDSPDWDSDTITVRPRSDPPTVPSGVDFCECCVCCDCLARHFGSLNGQRACENCSRNYAAVQVAAVD